MQELFLDKCDFNENINSWNVKNVTNMGEIFSGCSVFNQPLNNWDVCIIYF